MKKKPPLLDPPIRKHRPVTEEEKHIWKETIENSTLPAPIKKPAPPPRTKTPIEKPKKTLPNPAVIDKPLHKRIATARTVIEGKLDLHNHTQASAHAVLIRYIEAAHQKGLRTLLVITGKGKGAAEDTLRGLLPRWLKETPLREKVLGYDVAARHHGGEGAYYIRLRKHADSKRR